MESLSLGPPDNEGGHDHGDDEHGGHQHRALRFTQKSRREQRSTNVGNTTWDEVKKKRLTYRNSSQILIV